MSEPTSTAPTNRSVARTASTGRRWTTALVTGASSGIGDAFARQLASEGTDLVIVARDLDRLEALAQELRAAHGVMIEVLGADLSAPVSRAAIEKRLTEDARPIDLLVNNAGFGTSGDFVALPIGREEQEVQVNVLAVLRLTSAALGPMVARGSGAVLNVGSIAGLYPAPGSATYCATKAFVSSFGDSVHEELRGTGVTMTTSLPGFTRTEFQARSSWDDQSSVPGVAWLTPEKVAAQSLDAAAAGKARVVPSIGYKVLVGATSPLPASSRRWLLGRGRRALR